MAITMARGLTFKPYNPTHKRYNMTIEELADHLANCLICRAWWARMHNTGSSIPGPKPNEERREAILARYQAGMSMSKIAAEFKVSQPAISSMIHRAFTRSERLEAKAKAEAPRLMKVLDMHSKGVSLTEIAKELSMTLNAVYKAVTRPSKPITEEDKAFAKAVSELKEGVE